MTIIGNRFPPYQPARQQADQSLAGRRVKAAGLATGGGTLDTDPTITVTAATTSEAQTGAGGGVMTAALTKQAIVSGPFFHAAGNTSGRPLVDKFRETPSIFDYDGETVLAKTNKGISDLYNSGGGVLSVPPTTDGSLYGIAGSIILKDGVILRGGGMVPTDDTTAPYMRGAGFKPTANMAALITQDDLSTFIHSAGLEGIILFGDKASRTVAALLDWSPVNGVVKECEIENGSGHGIHHRANATAAWINLYQGNSLGACGGWNLFFEGSDTRIIGNYITAGGLGNVYLKTTGGVAVVANQIENCFTSEGMVCEPDATIGHFGAQIVGNFFIQNARHLRFKNPNGGTGFQADVALTGNCFHNRWPGTSGMDQDILVEAGIINGVMSGNIHALNPTASVHIEFAGAAAGTNGGWMVSAAMMNLGPAKWFRGKPVDLVYGVRGPSGSETRGGYGQFFDSQTILGMGNVSARFGVSLGAGFDASLLALSINGNSPGLAAADGETTAAVAFPIYYRGTKVWDFNFANLGNYANDAAAATGGVPVGAAYRNGSVLQFRVS